MTPDDARHRFAAGRVGRLATANAAGQPHLVPFVFVVSGDTIYSAVDHKPKRTTALRRLANVAENTAVAALVDEYDDRDWAQLWWVRAEGSGRAIDPSAAEGRRAVALLQERYGQYRSQPPQGPVLAVDVDRWSGWAATVETFTPKWPDRRDQ